MIVLISCSKEDIAKAVSKGSFSAKFSFYDATTKKWSTAETFTAITVVTSKTGNDYVSIATDASGNVFTLYGIGVTGVGKYTSRGIYVKSGKTYSSSSAQLDVTAFSSNKITATFITENTDWSMYDGKLEATF